MPEQAGAHSPFALATRAGHVDSVSWSFRIGRLFGIQVRLHLTFLPWIAFWAYSAWKEAGDPTAAVHAAAALLALFACVLLHEFGHILMARRFGIRTHDVTLLPIGGVARMESTGNTPRQELLIALAGPAVNVVIAAFTALLLWRFPAPAGGLDLDGLQGDLPTFLLAANIYLLLFNLLPAFPMDGGRVLRAVLSWRGDRARATRIAAFVGRVMAVLFAAAGLFQHAGNLLFFIAIFIWIGAGREAAAARVDTVVRAAMVTGFAVLDPFDTLADALRLASAGTQRDFPVVARGELLGLLRYEDLIPALRGSGPGTAVRDTMRAVSRSEVGIVSPNASLGSVARAIQTSTDGMTTILVVEDGRVVGMVTTESLGKFLAASDALGHPAGPVA